jgi:hypothetical protein
MARLSTPAAQDRPPPMPRLSPAHAATMPRIAVLVPCHNEAATIGPVIAAFAAQLPTASIHVFDNNSSDATIERARAAGAQVREVALQGKGNVVRRLFADVDADVYVLVDGDATYDAAMAPALIERLLRDGLDMVVGARRSEDAAAYRAGHRVGNVLLTRCVSFLFGRSFDDMLSGYRVFSRRYVKSFPVHAAGFETETELAVHALQLRMPVAEVATAYGARPQGSQSKLRTWHDGMRILLTILRLFKAERPLRFFSLGFGACVLLALGLAVPLVLTYAHTGLVPRFPTAILCSALVLLGFLLLACGLILDTVTRGRVEAKRLAYLAIPALPLRSPSASPTAEDDNA